MKALIFTLRTLGLSFSLLFISFSSWAVVGEDDRFYVRGTKWDSLFRGVLQIENTDSTGGCTGFLLEGDIVVTASHCWLNVVDNDMKFDRKKLSKYKVYFGDSFLKDEGFFKKIFSFKDDGELSYRRDMSADEKKEIEKSYNHSTRSKGYSIKDIYVEHSLWCYNKDSLLFQMRDFSFFTLKEPIPKNIKRFKLLGEMNLEEYDILDPSSQKGLSVSSVGYSDDTANTRRQRLAHVGCRIRDIKQKDGDSLYMTDCDSYKGHSGGPLFKILKHKKTGKVELGAIGVASINAGGLLTPRKRGRFKDSLGYGSRYTPFAFEGEKGLGDFNWMQFASISGKYFIDKLNIFRKDPSFFEGREVSLFSKNLQEEDLRKKIYAMGDLPSKEFKESLASLMKNFSSSILCDPSGKRLLLDKIIKDIAEGNIYVSDRYKRGFIIQQLYLLKILGSFPNLLNADSQSLIDSLQSVPLKRKDYPKVLSKRSRRIVYDQEISKNRLIFEVPDIFYDKRNFYGHESPKQYLFLNFLQTPSDSLKESRNKASKMWKAYFGSGSL